MGWVLGQQARAAVPAPLLSATVRGALALVAGRGEVGAELSAPVVALMKGVLHAMWLRKVKVGVLIVLAIGIAGVLIVLAIGIAGAGWSQLAEARVLPSGLPSAPAPQKASSPALTIPRNRMTHDGPVSSVSWSPDGKTLASASWDGTVRLWEAATGKEQATLQGHTWDVTSVSWSPDGKTLASASLDNTVKLWDVSPAR
jgi:hypothetical protein